MLEKIADATINLKQVYFDAKAHNIAKNIPEKQA
jgi:hypothetical protein